MTAHKVGDTVRSNVNARDEQGRAVRSGCGRARRFGVVTYRLRAEDGRELEVGNGHLLLERVANVR